MCMLAPSPSMSIRHRILDSDFHYSVQVNIPAETGEMGILAQHVPSIEQLKPGLVEVIEESGGTKQFFRMWSQITRGSVVIKREEERV